MINNLLTRPVELMHRLTRDYPDLSRQIDVFLEDKANGVFVWPAWCFLPMAGWYAIVSAKVNIDRLAKLEHSAEISRLAAIGAWRYTQGIYQIDETLFDALVKSPVSEALPSDVLLRLPEWCVYISTPALSWRNEIMYGFFAHLEYDYNNGQQELRLLLDCDRGIMPIVLPLGNWAITEAFEHALNAVRSKINWPQDKIDAEIAETIKSLTPIMSVLLYLCSDAPEINDSRVPGLSPSRPHAIKTKKGWKLYPAEKPHYWQVGKHVGEQLRAASAVNSAAETGRTVKAHLRRGHWHGYWIGPKTNRRFEYRWLHPSIVGGGD